MKKIFIFIFILSLSSAALAKSIWEAQKKPIAGKAESIGTYSLGCVVGADTIPLDGYGYQVMRPSRDRNHAHPEMKDYIFSLARDVKNKLKGVLMVGDVGLPAGGPFSYGHRSHQIGLDGDLWFWHPPAAKKRSLSRVERDKISAISMVDHRKKQVSKNWGAYQRNMLKIAASYKQVDRIFVNAVIKRELCKTDKGAGWLGKIRPWLGHDHHFHVRLKCPEGDKDCKTPEGYEPIKGDGCDETLDWWFKKPTKAEIAEWKKKQAEEKKKPKPKLPERCLNLVK